MRKNNLIWIFGFMLVISLPTVFAQSLFSGLSSIALFSNGWFIYFVNSFIVWFILFVLQSFIIPGKEGKEKAIIWIVTLVLSSVIAWNWGGDSSGYIWNVGAISTFFNLKILVNALLIGGAIYFGLGFLNVDPKTPQGKVGMVVLTILFAGMMAVNIGDKWLWDTNNYKASYDYLLSNQHTVPSSTPGGKPEIVGGILRPEQQNSYRLFVFLGSAFLWSWFFAAFLNLNNNTRLNYAMAIILGAIFARQGTEIAMVMALFEVFFLLVVGKQISSGGGLLGGWVGWGIAILLVEFIFCSMLGSIGGGQGSYLSQVLEKTLGTWSIHVPGDGDITPFNWLGDICGKVKNIVAPPGTGGGGGGCSSGFVRDPSGNCVPVTKTTTPTSSSWSAKQWVGGILATAGVAGALGLAAAGVIGWPVAIPIAAVAAALAWFLH